MTTDTQSKLTKFLGQDPTLLMQIGDWKLWEHPTRGDTSPICMSTPSGKLINTGFYDLGDFDLMLCVELNGGSDQ